MPFRAQSEYDLGQCGPWRPTGMIHRRFDQQLEIFRPSGLNDCLSFLQDHRLAEQQGCVLCVRNPVVLRKWLIISARRPTKEGCPSLKLP